MNWREKYRPTTLSELVGCESFTAGASEWTLEACPSNLLFVGPPGVGKTSAAFALAKDMMGEFFDPMNFVVTNASDDRGIDYVRELKRLSKQKGIGVKRRVFVLDEADNLTSAAQKALRQIMEESHKSAIFILTANDISPIHAAIRDRCLTYEFKPIHHTDTGRLGTIINAEGRPAEWNNHLSMLLQNCNGSLRKAIDVIESIRNEPDALVNYLKRDTNSLNKAALNLMGSDFPQVTALLVNSMESGYSRLGLLKGLRQRAKPLMESESDWHTFMLTYGEFVMLATQWPDDDLAFVEYFVAKLKRNMEEK